MALPKDYQAIASRHGLDLAAVNPKGRPARLAELREVLSDKTVKYAVSEERAAEYVRAAEAGEPFRVGSLTDITVDLGDYSASQHYDNYSFEEHLSWACLIADQRRMKRLHACSEYQLGEALFAIEPKTIPDYYLLNARVYQQTGWQLATVSEIIPAELFFTCHSKRFFPVTTFMRALEQGYLEEPDMGHDVAGHIATFSIPTVANLMQNHGLARDLIYRQRDERLAAARDQQHAERICARADELLMYAERIYWFTIEFGLVLQDEAIRAFGAGILSSPSETEFAVSSTDPNRILLDLTRETHLMRLVSTDYLISEFQKTYFVMQDLALLDSLHPERIVRACEKAARLPHFSWRDLVPGDRVLNVGTVATSVNEKYYRVLSNLEMDDCMLRTAMRNREILRGHIDRMDDGESLDLDKIWAAPLPPLPEDFLSSNADELLRVQECLRKPLSYARDYL